MTIEDFAAAAKPSRKFQALEALEFQGKVRLPGEAMVDEAEGEWIVR